MRFRPLVFSTLAAIAIVAVAVEPRLDAQHAVRRPIDGRPDDITGPLLEPILKPLYAAYGLVKLARDERDPLDLDLPERKILLKPDGSVLASYGAGTATLNGLLATGWTALRETALAGGGALLVLKR